MKKLLNNPFPFLFLLPAFFILHNYNELFGFIRMKEIAWSVLIVFTAMFFLYLLLRFIVSSAERASLLLFVISCFILFFRPLHGLAKMMGSGSLLSSYKIFLPACVALVVIVSRKILRSKTIPAKMILYLNTTMLCVFFIELGNSFVKFTIYHKDKNLIYPSKPICDRYLAGMVPDSSKPDIYFLVFDEYTNNEALKSIWKFNNDSITNWLRKKGFYVPTHSTANYDFTPYSMSSGFNMNWLDPKKGRDATLGRNVLQANQSMSDNELFCILKKEHYEIKFLAPFRNSIQDSDLGGYFDYLPEGQIFRQTIFGSLLKDISWNFRSRTQEMSRLKKNAEEFAGQNQKLLWLIKQTARNASASIPKFIYGHFMITHEPHFFDSEGALELKNADSMAFDTYTKQIVYANKVIQDLVDFISIHNKPNTIVIIEGDHGFRKLPKSLEAFRFPNFMAIYFPGQYGEKLSPTISQINLFRLVLNHSFRQQLNLLPDSTILVDQ